MVFFSDNVVPTDQDPFKNNANEVTKDIIAAYTKLLKEVVLVTALVRGRKALEARKE